jgi:hypothetical protein
VNCTGLFLVWNFFQELWNHKRIKILPGNRSKYFATDISGGSGISRFILQAKFAVSLSFADEVGCKVIFFIDLFRMCSNLLILFDFITIWASKVLWKLQELLFDMRIDNACCPQVPESYQTFHF